jgi:BASS family bile acid:Na+ symporter
MATTVFFLVLVPVSLGVFLNERRPDWADKLRKPFKILSAVIFICFVLIAIYGNLSQIGQYVKLVFGMTALHNGLALLGGFVIATLAGLKQGNRRTITLETGLQNSGLGMTLVFTFFPQYGGMAIVLAWWGIWHLITGFLLASIWGRRPPPEWVADGPRERVVVED